MPRRRGTGAALTALLATDHAPHLADGSILLVVEVAGRVVGFAHAHAHAGGGTASTPQPEISAFYVHPDSWGSGAAQALWSHALTLLLATAPATPVLWTLGGARRARAFYEHRGWRPTGRQREHDFGTGQPATVVEYRAPC